MLRSRTAACCLIRTACLSLALQMWRLSVSVGVTTHAPLLLEEDMFSNNVEHMITATSVRMLQAVAVIVGMAVVLWSIGIPMFRTAEAASVTSFSNTLSDSDASVVSNHTITFTTNDGVIAGEDIVLTFEAGTGIASLVAQDLDLSVEGTGDLTLADGLGAASGATWGVDTTGQVITIRSGTDTIGASATVTIEIGTNATSGGTGTNQITNPATGSYEIALASGDTDTGETRIAIVDDVTVTASVDTVFDFTVAGVGGGQAVNGTSTTGTSTSVLIPFGTLTAGGAPSTTAQDLTVTTNAAGGFIVTVEYSGDLQSSTGADIDAFVEGVSSDTPVAWAAPVPVLGSENTYGHWGLTTDDADLVSQGTDFGSDEWVGASTTPRVVFAHDDVADGAAAGIGSARIGYQIQISALQEAGNDYTTTLTYIATPTF